VVAGKRSRPDGARSGRIAALAAACLSAAAGTAPAQPATSAGREELMTRETSIPTAARPASEEVRLPDRLGAFTHTAEIRTILPAGIFEYMDGAGELYLAYRFDRLEVAEYASPESGEIVVELYRMRGSDDAYGLLSGDWGGERVALSEPAPAGPPRALYGAGLLRVWSDDLYARILATREGEASADAVLALGRAIVAGRRDPPPPALARALPETAAGQTLRADSVCFLRSHLVLNSAYFVSRSDILDLGPDVDAVTARYGAWRVVLVRYPDPAAARRAAERFRAAYLPEAGPSDPIVRVEDGWAGARTAGRGLAVVFQAGDREAAAALLAAGARVLESVEASHE
jgi:hypothetical protein